MLSLVFFLPSSLTLMLCYVMLLFILFARIVVGTKLFSDLQRANNANFPHKLHCRYFFYIDGILFYFRIYTSRKRKHTQKKIESISKNCIWISFAPWENELLTACLQDCITHWSYHHTADSVGKAEKKDTEREKDAYWFIW